MPRHHDPQMFTGGNTIIRKRLSFFSVAALGLTTVVVSLIVAGSALAFRAMAIVDTKADTLTALVTDVMRTLPEIREALPPALADAIDDVRQPDYLEHVRIDARMVESDSRGYSRSVIKIANEGDEVISLLSLRIVGLDAGETPVWEESTWGATPIQIEDDWRGPLMPGTTRTIPLRTWSRNQAATLQCEVTDVRVWRGSHAVGCDETSSALTIAR